MNCKICNGAVDNLFKLRVLGKYDVQYYKCNSCAFIFTEEPYWLTEAYSSAITKLDIGLIHRNIILIPSVTAVINFYFDNKRKFIDYGGGYGLFVRLMRDKGFDFYRQDPLCDNIFSRNFDIGDIASENKSFELVTAFEVFEHLVDPIAEIEKMLTYSRNILFSTELVNDNIKDAADWWYLAPETGQHIALFTVSALEHLAKRFNLNFYTNGRNLHLLTAKKISKPVFRFLMRYREAIMVNKIFYKNRSLLPVDYQFILQKVRGEIN